MKEYIQDLEEECENLSEYNRLLIERIKELEKTDKSIRDSVLNEITSFCGTECSSSEFCPEDKCVLFKIEKIIERS